MFHKVVWQHMQIVMGFFKQRLCCKFTKESSSEKNENRLRFDRIMAKNLWPHFFGPSCRNSARRQAALQRNRATPPATAVSASAVNA